MKNILLISLLSITSIASYAYIPPSSFLIKKLTEKRKGLENIKIEAEIEIENQKYSEVVYFNNGQILSHRNIDIECIDSDSYKFLAVLLFDHDSKKVMDFLKSKNIPVKDESEVYTKNQEGRLVYQNEEALGLGRVKGKIAYIIGGDERKKLSTQIWINKENFLLQKIVMNPNKAQNNEDLQVLFEEYKNVQNYFLPGTLTVLQNDKKIMKISFNKITINAKKFEMPKHDKIQKCDSLTNKNSTFNTYLKVIGE